MSFKIRTVQNKPKRETNEIKNAELQEIRKENQKLKREIARLRKELAKPVYSEPSDSDIKEMPKDPQCPSCGSDQMSQIQFNVKIFSVCKKCKWRKPLESAK